MKSSKPVIELSYKEAADFFRQSKQYVNFDLPDYFSFDDILTVAGSILINKQIADICIKNKKGKPIYPADFSDVNCTIFANKDGGFDWRPLQLIHPVLYVDLVNLITNKGNWRRLKNLFKKRDATKIKMISMPVKSLTKNSDKAAQVSEWWDGVEQESIRLALDYKYMFVTDITNCYGSIYTHSFEWAMYAKGRASLKNKRNFYAKKGKKPKSIPLGSDIDKKLRNMNHGQTVGIPQGSVLMDFLAEIILAGVDIELEHRILSSEEISDKDGVSILRYRDDYRIFSNIQKDGHVVMKLLGEVLSKWNFKMNSGKTSSTNDLIKAAIKTEKLDEIYQSPSNQGLQKDIMRSYLLSSKYPNSGIVAKKLTEFFDKVSKIKNKKNIDYDVVIAIITMIAYKSPRYIAQAASIISLLIDKSEGMVDRDETVRRILNRFDDLPNTEFIDVWLQRIMSADKIVSESPKSNLAQVALGESNNASLWNLSWIGNTSDRSSLEGCSISNLRDRITCDEFNPVIPRREFELFRREYE